MTSFLTTKPVVVRYCHIAVPQATIHGTVGLGPATAKPVIVLRNILECISGMAQRERFRTELYGLTDSELVDIDITA